MLEMILKMTSRSKPGRKPIYASLYDRILAHSVTIPFCGCWVYIGTLNHRGYGMISIYGKGFKKISVNGNVRYHQVRAVHKIMYEELTGTKVPEGIVLRHTCDIRACWRPDHLVQGTQKENVADQIARERHVSQVYWTKEKYEERSSSYLVKRILEHGY